MHALPAAALIFLKNSKAQEAVIEKGIEVAGKLVDKRLKIIDEAQEKAEQFLKKELMYEFVLFFVFKALNPDVQTQSSSPTVSLTCPSLFCFW